MKAYNRDAWEARNAAIARGDTFKPILLALAMASTKKKAKTDEVKSDEVGYIEC